MRHSRRLALGSIGIAALTLGVIFSGCGAATTTGGHGVVEGAATATATPLPTETLPPITGIITEWPGCPRLLPMPNQPNYVAVGGLEVSVPQRWGDYPSELMPNNEPNAPYKVPLTMSDQQVGAFHPNPPVNPQLEPGYFFQICNKTSASHSLTNMSVRIASFSAHSGPVTVWHICENGPFDPATKQTTPGCGGGSIGSRLTASLLNDSPGASAPVTGTAWPVTISPNKAIVLAVALNGLTAQGTYTLSFGISVDGAAPRQVTPSDGAFLMAPSAIVWTGTACQTPAMQAQIPASSQDAYYVCPPAS